MTAPRILVVDDELSIRNLLQRYLQRQDYLVEVAETGSQALERLASFRPNLVVLDLNLPDISGYEVCQTIQKHPGIYVLMLTSRVSAADKLQGFSLGADDYLTKPFNLPEVAARVAALLRRQRAAIIDTPTAPVLVYDSLSIDPEGREVSRNQQIIPLTALEFDLLYVLARYPGRVWRRTELIQEVWDFNHDGDERVVDVHIGQIRKKLETDVSQPELIRTVRGVGYKFEPPNSSEAPWPTEGS
ncbi:MAG: response regulator transcription factor [Cyanobacteriota bacterium]|nr:response regulator transcription factor [Cyanobacteriota bacterium]